jgi:hypothetical protein
MFAKYKKQITLLAIAFVVFLVYKQPTESADLVRNAMTGIGAAADQLAEFVRSLAA